ncbi:NUDIX domain-containing protein [Olivibacter sp. CPCC 100613]|uniref:NUDIX domain-containing protein n=1 Tax=Olivibacter sp. CPCC 100613 TaxID=3079931 RepID=UPI002FFBA14B
MKRSAGILLYRVKEKSVEFFLVHPGGPFFVKKDKGFWTIPKGEFENEESALSAAKREFEEETGHKPKGEFMALDSVIQKGGKKILCWLLEGDIDLRTVRSNTFEMIWPPKSGKMQRFPEIDKAGWFSAEDARQIINERQSPFIDQALSFIRNAANVK